MGMIFPSWILERMDGRSVCFDIVQQEHSTVSVEMLLCSFAPFSLVILSLSLPPPLLLIL